MNLRETLSVSELGAQSNRAPLVIGASQGEEEVVECQVPYGLLGCIHQLSTTQRSLKQCIVLLGTKSPFRLQSVYDTDTEESKF